MIKSLLYLYLGTRPDIAFTVIKLLRFILNPNDIHFSGVYRIFKYLKTTIKRSIYYYLNNSNKYINTYCNTNYTGDLFTIKSTSGFIFILADSPIS